MDVMSRLRLLRGPVLPFLLAKLKNVPMRRWRTAQAHRKLRGLPAIGSAHYTPLGITVPEWVAQPAQNRLDGAFDGYGVDLWDRSQMTLEATNPDPRAVLELARMHQWVNYAAASADGRAVWFEAFEHELEAFSLHHPPMKGPLWQTAMDSGIRVYNMLLATDVFYQHGFQRDVIDDRVATMAVEHAISIEGALETAGGMSTSHLLGNLLGLIAVKHYVGWVGGSSGIDAEAEFERQLQKQVLADGTSFEASTGYHLQVLDIIYHVSQITKREYPQLRQMQKVMQHLWDAGYPIIGDNDDGLVVKPCVLKPQQRKTIDQVVALEHFGLWMWHKDDVIVTARNGFRGQYGKGGHAHEDQNSITIRVAGVPIIVDPGCSIYTANATLRNLERSSYHHATVNVNQGWWPSGTEGLFWMLQDESKRSAELIDEFQWQGRVAAVDDPSDVHTRTISMDSGVQGTDTVTKLSVGRVISFPLHPDCTVKIESNTAIICIGGVCTQLSWDNATVIVEPSHVANGYGNRVPNQVIRLQMNSRSVHWHLVVLNQ